MAVISNTTYNLLNSYTGEYQTFNKVTTWLDGTPMSDAKCDGTIFRKKDADYFKLNWTGPVNFKWFGAKGDGLTNDTIAVQKAIDTFRVGTQGSGQSFLFPQGTYLLDNIKVPSGTRIFADQTAKYIYIPNLHTKIIPATQSTEYVFYFEDNCINSELKGIYVEGIGYPNLKAAVRFTGNSCNLEKCLFNACQQTAVLSSAGNSFIQECGIFGWYGPAPTFTSINDFRAALQIEVMGDAYILNNEIGAGLPYFDTYPNPMDMLRDPINRRICSMACIGFFGTSVISGNLFENGDRGVVLSGAGLYCTFHHNRYELSGGTGLTILNGMGPGGGSTYFTFIGERFSDNSLAGDGVFDDIFLTPGTAGYISFIAPIFEKLSSPLIPTSTYKVKWHINNQASTTIELVSPQVDPTYALKGLINNEDVTALPVRQAVMQYDPKNPLFNTVSTKKEVVDPQTGYVTLIPGTTAGAGNLIGGVQFYDSTSTPKALLGFNAANDFWFNLNQSGGSYIFVNGPLYATKAAGNSCTINTTDNGVVAFNLSQNNGTNGTFGVTVRPDNTTVMGADHDLTIGLVTGGSIKVSPDGKVFFPFSPAIGTTSTVDIITRNTTTGQMEVLPSNTFAIATGGTGYIQNQTAAAQVASYSINGIGRIESGLSIAMGAAPAYPLQVGTLPSTLNVSAQFLGTIIADPAVAANEVVVKSQLDAKATIYTADGALVSSRSITTDNFNLRFLNNRPSFIEFKRTGNPGTVGNSVVSVGMLGQPEANLSFNMDYTDGTHRLYDNTKGATWLALGPNGSAIQYAPATTSTSDVWSIAGSPYAMYWSYTGTEAKAAINTNISNPTGDGNLLIKRTASQPSLTGDVDIVVEGHRTKGTSGLVYINAYNTGNVIVAAGGGNVSIGSLTNPTDKLLVYNGPVAIKSSLPYTNNAATAYMTFKDVNDVIIGAVGDTSSNNTDMYFINSVGGNSKFINMPAGTDPSTADSYIAMSINNALDVNVTKSLKVSGKFGLLSTGAAKLSGLASFPAGTTSVVVNTTSVTANTLIFLTAQSFSDPTSVVSAPIVSARTAGTSFTINWSIPNTESGTVGWMLVEPF